MKEHREKMKEGGREKERERGVPALVFSAWPHTSPTNGSLAKHSPPSLQEWQNQSTHTLSVGLARAALVKARVTNARTFAGTC